MKFKKKRSENIQEQSELKSIEGEFEIEFEPANCADQSSESNK